MLPAKGTFEREVHDIVVWLAWLMPGGPVPKDLVDRAMQVVDCWIAEEEKQSTPPKEAHSAPQTE